VGSFENHGVLPPETDTLLAGCVSRRAAERGRSCRLAAAPPVAYSTAFEHSEPRVAVPAAVFIEYLKHVVRGLAGRGGCVVIAVFHGGAYPAAYLAARELRAGGVRAAVYDAWGRVAAYLEESRGARPGIIHADGIEASMLLACGSSRGVREAGLEEALAAAGKPPPWVAPWIYSDLPGLYPSEHVPASLELGEELVGFLAEDLSEYACRLAGGEEAKGAGGRALNERD
jgi:creatinine amidohydrolase/Fe(II)-dependent formamide hydrolase-like protein